MRTGAARKGILCDTSHTTQGAAGGPREQGTRIVSEEAVAAVAHIGPVSRAHVGRWASRLEALIARDVVEVAWSLLRGGVCVLHYLLHCGVLRDLHWVRLRRLAQEAIWP